MNTPCFFAWRRKLAAYGRRASRGRQQSPVEIESQCRLSLQGVPGWMRTIKVVDASSVRLPDTAANRKLYPYPSGQKPGCGFPVMQVCGLYSLSSGAILKTKQGSWAANEVRLFKDLWPELHSGDICAAGTWNCASAI